MAHFAKIDNNNIVTEVIVSEQNFINSGHVGDSFSWVQCSYNSNFRGNYPAVGYTYDRTTDKFIPPQPFNSWVLNTDTYNWEPPTPKPISSFPGEYTWNEETQTWDQVND